MTRALRVSMMGLVAIAMLGLVGCASSGSSTQADNGKPANVLTAVPSGSPLAKVQTGMTEIQVRKIMGEPDNSRSYMTGKAWIPFYFGGDTHRVDWTYNGVGRVVFTRNRWSGSITVVDRMAE